MTGLWSMLGSPASMRTICNWQLVISGSVWVLVKSVIWKFLVKADPLGPVTKPAGPRGSAEEFNDTRRDQAESRSLNAELKLRAPAVTAPLGWRGRCSHRRIGRSRFAAVYFCHECTY